MNLLPLSTSTKKPVRKSFSRKRYVHLQWTKTEFREFQLPLEHPSNRLRNIFNKEVSS